MSRRTELAAAAVFVTMLTVLVTWPQTPFVSSRLIAHQDPLFSVWRLAWIAHALRTAPGSLFDANIFHPATDTLAFSDATMLQGLLGAPMLWLGMAPVLVYNLLLLAGFVGSGLATFVLARHLTGSMAASLVSAAVCTLLPYRIEHVMHLELQWMMFVPLTWWALHRLVESGAWRWGVVAGVCFWLQVLACIYYGVFLAMALVVFVPALLVASGARRSRAALPGLGVAFVVAAALTLPFALPYRTAVQSVGARPFDDIARYSATSLSYLATSSVSWVWGWTADRWGGPELRLFPGITAIVLALVGLFRRPRGLVFVYLLTTAVAIDLSFGLNGPGYRTMLEHLGALQGFRALARFAAIGSASLVILVAFGAQLLLDRPRSHSAHSLVIAALAVMMVADYGVRPASLMPGDPVEPPDTYKVLRRAAPGVVLELPLPRLDRLPGNEPMYEAWSLWHWKPLVNGYSGYYPPEYLDTVARMHEFPDDSTLEFLRARDVKYVVVHKALMDPERYTELLLGIASRADIKAWGTYKDPVGTADIFEISRVD